MIRLELSIPPDNGNITYIDQLLEETFQAFFSEGKDALFFAAHEIVINAMQSYHKQEEKSTKNILIKIFIEEDMAEIVVSDWFGGIDISKDEAIRLPKGDSIFKENGRGLFLADELMDEFQWQLHENGEFRVTLKKSR